MNEKIDRAREKAAIVLGAFTGGLIMAPVGAGGGTLLLLPLGLVLGGMVGYRRRHNFSFIYLCVFCILILSTIYLFQMTPPPRGG
jgi:uncharacterized membrane protein